MTNWFTNKGQIIQAAAAVLACLLTLINFLRQGSSPVWLIASAVLLAVVTLSAWLSIRSSYLQRRGLLLRLFRRLRDHAAAYRELMRRFPNSPAVASPFDTTWRPEVGETQIRTDYDKMIGWADDTHKLLIHAEPFIGKQGCYELAQRLRVANSSLDIMHILCELEQYILVTIDPSFAPTP